MSTITDAKEFGAHIKHGGWRLGLLVARNVEKGLGDPTRTRNDRYASVKVSVNAFAEQAGTSAPRVSRYLDAWERAADAGHVPHAADLTPKSKVTLPDDETVSWGDYYTAVKGGRVGNGPDGVVTIIGRKGVAAVVAELPEDMLAELLAEILRHKNRTQPTRTVTPAASPDYDEMVSKGTNFVMVAVSAESSGETRLSPQSQALLYFTGQALLDRQMPDGNFDGLIADIEAYANKKSQ